MPEPSTSNPQTEPEQRSPLPIEAIELLWEQLALTYGHLFLSKWEGFDHEAVRADWAKKLAGLTPAHLDYGIEHVQPGRPPDALEFRAIAVRMPSPERFKLPPKRGGGIPAEVRAALQALAEPSEDKRPGRVRWAEGYVGKFATSLHLTPFQKEALAHARAVLRRWEIVQSAEAKAKEAARAAEATSAQP